MNRVSLLSQETLEQRERNNPTLVTEQFQRECNSLASPRSIGTADDITSKTETAPEVLARLEQSEMYIFMKCIPQIISDAHACDLIQKFPLDLRSDLGLVTEDEISDVIPPRAYGRQELAKRVAWNQCDEKKQDCLLQQ